MRTFIEGMYHHWLMRRDPIKYAKLLGVTIGEGCRLMGLQLHTFGSEPYLVRLGDRVTISTGARFITHDGGVWVFRGELPTLDVFAPITVGNNVFVGANAMILKGVEICDDCIIGAGAVVTRPVPAGSVVGGCPARHIKTVDEYWSGIEESAVYIRGVSQEEKQRVLLEMFKS